MNKVPGRILLGILVAFLVILGVRIAVETVGNRAPTVGPEASPLDVRTGSLTIRALIRGDGPDSIQTFVVVENVGVDAVGEVVFEPLEPLAVTVRGPRDGTSSDLEAGQTRTWLVELAPGGAEEWGPLTGTLRWSGINGAPSEVLFPLGSVSRSDRSRWRLGWSALYNSLKDFGLPLALGLLAYFYQRAHTERTDRNSVREAMLTIVHKNATEHWLPITGLSKALVSFVEKAHARSDDVPQEVALRKSLIYCIRMISRMRVLVTGGGGIFLGRQSAELFVYECWYEILNRARKQLGVDRLDIARAIPENDLPELMRRLADDPTASRAAKRGYTKDVRSDLVLLRKDWSEWVLDKRACDLDLRLWKLFRKVLHYEINDVYDYWYRDLDEGDSPCSDLDELLRLDEGLGKEKERLGPRFREKAYRYRERLGSMRPTVGKYVPYVSRGYPRIAAWAPM